MGESSNWDNFDSKQENIMLWLKCYEDPFSIAVSLQFWTNWVCKRTKFNTINFPILHKRILLYKIEKDI